MRVFKYALVTVLSLIVLLAVVGLLLPDRAHVERSIQIDSNPSTLFTVLNSFRLFNEWSPWHGRDPNAEYTYSGPSAGVGAKMSWASEQRDVGSGSQEITESEPYSHIKTSLDFGTQGNAYATFSIEPNGGASTVTWALDAEFGSNLVERYFGLFFDKLVGGDYEKGLVKLKTFAETLPDADFSGVDPQILEFTPIPIAYASGSTSDNPTAIAAALAVAYVEVTAFMEVNDLARVGPPLVVERGRESGSYQFDAAIPLAAEAESSAGGKVLLGTTYGGAVVRGIHTGPYYTLESTHEKVVAFVAASGLVENGDPWNEFVTDPGTTAPENIITHVYYPVR